MSNQVLARKWRPQQFSEVVGQQTTLQALANALDQQRLHHAYLFTGTRGVGKTTIARILAKCLNCEQGISATPCGVCQSCKEISEGRFVDLIEVDAASRTKVEDTRDLLDNVQYNPTRGRYKVYLIDEVHMLSGHSFNALLKTLEEPPAHVIFLLATTDPQKLPVTILSRCLQFHLKHISVDVISQQLVAVLDNEGIAYEPVALKAVAKAANGSMRDALSLLDQGIAYSQGNISSATIAQMLGLIAHQELVPLLEALAQQDGQQLLRLSEQLAINGMDLQQALGELLHLLHQISVIQVVPEAATAEDEASIALHKLAQSISHRDIQLFYQIGLLGQQELPLAPSPKTGFDMVLLRMLAFQPHQAQAQANPAPSNIQQTKPKQPQSKPAATVAPAADVNTTPQQTPEVETLQPKAAATTKPQKAPIDLNHSPWEDTVSKLKLTGLSQVLISHCVLDKRENQTYYLTLDGHQAPMLNERQQQAITKAISEHCGEAIKVVITPGETDLLTPARLAQLRAEKKLEEATQTIEQDPNVQALMSKFNATIQPGSIKPV